MHALQENNFFSEAYSSHCRGMILELLLFGISDGNSLSAQNRFFVSWLHVSYNILDFPTGAVLFTRAQFLCLPVMSAQCWSEEEKDKHNTSSSVHGNGEK